MERDGGAAVATFHTPERPRAGAPLTLGEEVARHVRVRRLALGERVRLADGAGAIGTGTLVRAARSAVTVDVESVEEMPPPAELHLLVPVGDRDRMLWAAEKVVELGLTSWRPVLWKRSRSVTPRGEGSSFQAKVRARMISALEQSGGAWLPAIFPDAQPDHAAAAAPAGARIVLDREGEPLLALAPRPPATIALGPEGGLEPDERTLLLEAGFAPASLAESVLRFETAAVAAVAIVRAAYRHAGEGADVR